MNDLENPQRKTILQIYAVLGAGLILSIFPFFAAAGLSLLLTLGALIAAYMVRAGDSPDSLAANHMTYIIRTIWIGSFLALITITIASLYLFQAVDNTPLDPCIRKFYDISMGGMAMNMDILSGTFSSCFVSYMGLNIGKFFLAAAIAAVPVLLYFSVRYVRGLTRAINGHRIAEPQSWF